MQRWFIFFIVLGGFCIRLKYFGLHRFHIDEAVYSAWAYRIYDKFDILLNGASGVDKPPFLFYLQALAYWLFGVSENTARIPNFLASVASIYVIYLIGKKYWDEKIGLIAAILMAFSPLCIAYSNSAFTDPLMNLLILLSIYFISREQYFYAGLFTGLSLATKQFAVIIIPLYIVLLYAQSYQKNHTGKEIYQSYGKGFGLVFVLLLLISAFSNPAFGFIGRGFQEQAQVVTPISESVWQRMTYWINSLQNILGSMILNVMLMLSVIVLLMVKGYELIFVKPNKYRWADFIPQYSAIFFLGFYFMFLLFTNVKLYSRYILPIAPFAFLIVAQGIQGVFHLIQKARVSSRQKQVWETGIIIVVLVVSISTARNIERTTLNDGAFYSANDGIEKVAWFFENIAMPEPVVFTRGAGWCYNFYCRDAGIKKRIDLVDAETIRRGIQTHPKQPYYLVWQGQDIRQCEALLKNSNFKAVVKYGVVTGDEQRRAFTIYEIMTEL